jgi:hypothetical protein
MSRMSRESVLRRLGALALLLLILVGVGAAPAAAATTPASRAPAPAVNPGGGARATDIATVASALAIDPLYVSTAPGTPGVVAGDVRGALPPDVYVAVLPAAAADQVGGETAALPGAILGRLSRPGTVLVLAGRELDGASRTQRIDRLQSVLDDARSQLAAGGPPAPALVLAARGLSGSGQLSDPPAATRAGSPNGGGFLWAVLALVVAAVLAIPILLRRARSAAPTPPPRLLRDRVEVDATGRVVRRVTARELAEEQERRPGGDS